MSLARPWFVRKRYGWGWTPVTWQGWLFLFIFLGLTAWNFLRIDRTSHSVSDTLMDFIPQTLILIIVFLFGCWKTGEKPKWQWGEEK